MHLFNCSYCLLHILCNKTDDDDDEAGSPSYITYHVAYYAPCLGECDDRRHMRRSSVRGPGQPDHTLCVSSYPPYSGLDDWQSPVTGDGWGIKTAWLYKEAVRSDACSLGGPNRRRNLYVTIARHQTLCSYTQCHPHRLPGVHRSVKNQAKQNIYSVLFRRESDAALLRDHPPPTYSCRDCLLSIRLWVNIGLSKFKGNNSSFTSLIIIKAVQ